MAYPGRSSRAYRPAVLAALAGLALTVVWSALPAPAQARLRTLHFQGQGIRVPATWPVYRLAAHPRMCVRLDRQAVYLGTPSASQRCPAHAVGRRRAILVDPAAVVQTEPGPAAAPKAGKAGAARKRPWGAGRAGAARKRPWGAARAPFRLGTPSLSSSAHVSTASAFTGLGFDACAAPSARTMLAWGGSPYRGIGVYIGGANRACAQPSLTSGWVGEQVGAGWHLIPTYVGLQAPTSSCGSCEKLSASAAASQGSAAANDAVNQARAVAIGPGNPIYFDMEAYTRTAAASEATLTFLSFWTARLHALGYVSGVYSSSSSGIADLASRIGTGYLEPDDIWIANWNERESTSDPVVPASAWSQHQRLHQYRGGHNETYGGVTINIDNDYVEGATVGTVVSSGEDPKGRLETVRSPRRGRVRVIGWAFDPNAPTEPVSLD
ncbi:MAG: DUF1906 domain-containing protein, partial [Solirubrobacterales bacterium]